jgi:hypothetical protein
MIMPEEVARLVLFLAVGDMQRDHQSKLGNRWRLGLTSRTFV